MTIKTMEVFIMKKTAIGIFAAAAAFLMGTSGVSAAGVTENYGICIGTHFVDEDCDGICDNCGAYGALRLCGGRHFVDDDCDGICDNCGA